MNETIYEIAYKVRRHNISRMDISEERKYQLYLEIDDFLGMYGAEEYLDGLYDRSILAMI